MNNNLLVDGRVTYTPEHNGRFFVVEHVPARVDEETGELFYTPSTVEQLHQVIPGEQQPDRLIETPVNRYNDRAA